LPGEIGLDDLAAPALDQVGFGDPLPP
jgi:hypothetical protein